MRKAAESVPMKIWSDEPPSAEVRQALGRLRQADDVRRIAVMPDVHLAHDVCNGVAIATRELIYPQAVGGDIGCGMLATAFDGEASPLTEPAVADRVLSELARRIPSNKLYGDAVPGELPDDLTTTELSDPALDRLKQRDGRYQLGTLGRGNHFVELQADADGRLWAMIHSGSRGMGQAITAHHLKRATRHGPGGLLALNAEDDLGRGYLNDLAWAIRYAEENRLAMLRAVEMVLIDTINCRADRSSLIHIHHNHVRRESHFGELWWVHRKGAMPAEDGLPGVIPGSMGTCSFHVTGRGSAESLRSCSHGAGRALPRGVAFQQIPRREFLRQMDGVAFEASRAELLRDEAPSAYKNIRAVMRAQRDLTRIVRELRPLLVYKGV